MDWYGGIKPTWGKATFDFGVIYYTYPGSDSIPPLFAFPISNYVELKAGVSGDDREEPHAGGTIYWSPDYFAETGSVWTFEGAAGYTFHQVGVFTPERHGRDRLSDQFGRRLRSNF